MGASLGGYVSVERAGAAVDSPALFLFHGTGGDEHQFLDLGAELLPGARRIGVRGDVSEGGALRYFKRLAEGRYDMVDFARAVTKMAGFVGGATGAASETIGLGYSNGANILAGVLFEAPERFDRSVLMHPLIPFTPKPQPGLKGKRVLITAGRRDPMASVATTEALREYFAAQGAKASVVWHDGGHEIRREELLAARDFLSA